MAGAASSSSKPLLCALAPLLLGCLCARPAGAHSLCYDTTLQKSAYRQLSCEIQGHLDKMAFLNYSSSNGKFSPLAGLGERISATETWKKQTESLKDMLNIFQKKLLDIQKYDTIRDPLSLQATLCCQGKGNGHVHGSSNFNLNRNKFHFIPDNKKWIENHPGSIWMEEWEEDSDVMEFLYRTLLGDCKTWLEEFSVPLEEMLEATAPPATVPVLPQPQSKSTALMPNFLLIILTCSILLVIYREFFRMAG